MNQDDPFFDPGDSDRTVVRPMPGGRRASNADVSPPPTAPIEGTATSGALGKLAGTGLNPLVESASSLLGLVNQLRSSVDRPDPAGLRKHVVDEVGAFEASARAKGLNDKVVLPARYALCSLLDEAVLGTPWGGESVWSKHGLLITFHNEAHGGEKFFDMLKRLLAYPSGNLDLLELMYLCLALGFVGRYRLRDDGRNQLEVLRERVYQTIRSQRGEYERDLSPNWQGIVERRNPIIRVVPLWALSAVAAAILVSLFTGLSFALNSDSDPVFAKLHNLDEGLPTFSTDYREPLIAPSREPDTEPEVTVAPPPTLRELLAPEIQAGLVEVVDGDDGSTVRIHGDQLFRSGRASVNLEFLPLLTRIGEALALLPGRVLVTGHTDSVPIKTLRFPSNWHLSQARAANVTKILGDVTADPARFRSEGRADTELLVPNNSRAARNRRVEITLLKQSRTG